MAIPENHTYNQKLRLYLAHNESYNSLKNVIFPIAAIVFFFEFSE